MRLGSWRSRRMIEKTTEVVLNGGKTVVTSSRPTRHSGGANPRLVLRPTNKRYDTRFTPLSYRGQMEIMGLAIVVILITLGVLFALTTLQQDEGGGEQAFEQKGIAGGFLNSFLGTTTPCERLTIQDLIRDCAQRGGFVCGAEYDPFAPFGKQRELDSCSYANQTAAYLFNQTLDARKIKYLLSAKGPNMERIGIGNPCRGEQVLASQPIPTRVGTVTIELRVCG